MPLRGISARSATARCGEGPELRALLGEQAVERGMRVVPQRAPGAAGAAPGRADDDERVGPHAAQARGERLEEPLLVARVGEHREPGHEVLDLGLGPVPASADDVRAQAPRGQRRS